MPTKTTKTPVQKSETIHIKSDGKHRPKVTVLVGGSEDILERQVHGFVGFLREKAIVGLAVGFVVATQVQTVVKQLITSFLDPLTTVLFGAKLSNRTFTWTWHGRHSDFAWGQFVYVLIDFFVVVITIYAIIKLFKLDKLDAPKPAETKK
jgi:large-conductance mechanosensitive channel